jgi:superoxide dismutase, Cu-Zn family
MRRLLIILPALLVTGCAGTPNVPVEIPGEAATPPPAINATVFGTPAASGFYRPDTGTAGDVVAQGTFEEKSTTAVTYEPRLVPAGSTAHVTVTRLANGMQVRLAVTGMLPRRTYGAHLHTKPCMTDPTGAGPHYQHNPDPMASASAPSADPSYANPQNEVWLDFTADRLGAATATAVLTWIFDELTPPRSLVLHATRTRTGEGFAGTAGARVACLTLPA